MTEQTNNFFPKGMREATYFDEISGTIIAESSSLSKYPVPRNVSEQFRIRHTSTSGTSSRLELYSNRTNKWYYITLTHL